MTSCLTAFGRIPHWVFKEASAKNSNIRHKEKRWCAGFPAIILVLAVCRIPAATLPSGFIEQTIGSGWNEVVGLTFAADNRMFVWERGGRVWTVENGVKSAQPFLDIHEEVGGWRDFGLLGFCLDPNFSSNGHVYLLYVVDHHHLTKFGTPNYDPNTDEYFMGTIGRITRYTARASDGFRSIDYNTRRVLLGETINSGFAIVHESHGVGSLLFGTDGTLLASCGDGASYNTTDTGSDSGTYYAQCLSEGILQPKQNIGALRAQLVDCLNGKVVRIDPANGDGLPSNPFYDASDPRAPRSRVWAMGLRNPCRVTLRPDTGSHNPADGDPGVLYIGDVGWNTWEDLNVCTGPGKNFGWPIFEGMTSVSSYSNAAVNNLDAPNPLYGGGCARQYFQFRELIKQDSLNPASWPNPCNASQQIPATIPRFVHTRPAIDWNHSASGPSRTGTFDAGGNATVMNLSAGGSPVPGPNFGGNCSIGAAWYEGNDFPSTYKNSYFHGDYGQGWIRNFVFDSNNKPVSVRDFLTGGGGIVFIATHPTNGALYYISWASQIHKILYAPGGNQPPISLPMANKIYGATPLTVKFTGTNSVDPEGTALTYGWNFGDGTTNNTANPSHVFSAPVGVITNFTVKLIVKDAGNGTGTNTLKIHVNNTPPAIAITSPTNGTLYPMSGNTIYPLTASVSDAEHPANQLSYAWQTFLHHNDHEHQEPVDTNLVSSTTISPVGCDTETFYYRVRLTVADPTGLSGSADVFLYPNCPPVVPSITAIADQAINLNGSTGPLPFTVDDADTPASSLTLKGNSSNLVLVPTNNIIFGGSGSNRTVTVTPASGQSGMTTITVSVSDGETNTSTSFVLMVGPLFTATQSFTNATAITIPDQGAGTPYPSTINVTGMNGIVSNVTVMLKGLDHTWKSDVDVLLVSPGGQKVMLMSDAGDIYTASGSVTLTLSDGAAAVLPASTAISSGTFKPTNYSDASLGGDNFPTPAPGAPYGGTLSVFNGTAANGTWSLYVYDDGPGDLGSFAGGWSLTLTTVATPQTPVITWTNPAAITYGTALGGSQLNATANVPGTFAYNPVTGTVLNAGNAQNLAVTFTPNDTQNYTVTMKTVLLSVQKVPLSVVVNNATRMYGETNPVFTATLTGVQIGDNITVSHSCPATIDSPVGSYVITPTLIDPGGRLVNYNVAVTGGILTIIDMPRVLGISESPEGTFVIQCQVYAGRTYRFQCKNSLADSNWTNLGADQTAVSASVAITNANAMSQRFYRLLDVTAP